MQKKNFLHDLAKPYILPGSDEGILFIHGFTGSPSHFAFMKDLLHVNEGYTLHAPLLKGHGTHMDDMKNSSWHDWINDVVTAYEKLESMCSKIHVIGYSMGALLALILAAQKPVDKLITIAPALIPRDKRTHLIPILKYFIEYKVKTPFEILFPDEVADYEMQYDVCYEKYPLKSVEDYLKIAKEAKLVLPSVKAPLLIFHSHADKIVHPKSAHHIYDNVGSEKKEIIWLTKSRHLYKIGPEKEIIHDGVLSFLKGK